MRANDIRNWTANDAKMVIAIYVALLLFMGTLVVVCLLIHANEVSENIRLSGELSAYSDHGGVRERAIGTGEHLYSKKINWDSELGNQTFKSQYMLDPTTPKFWNQYYLGVNSPAVGWQHELRTYNLSGPFEGVGLIKTSPEDLDSTFWMEGAGELKGRVVSSESGKPEWVTQTFGAGNFSIESHVNISKLKRPSGDWLSFCDHIDLPPELRWNRTRPDLA
jgi:hypothetical protein